MKLKSITDRKYCRPSLLCGIHASQDFLSEPVWAWGKFLKKKSKKSSIRSTPTRVGVLMAPSGAFAARPTLAPGRQVR